MSLHKFGFIILLYSHVVIMIMCYGDIVMHCNILGIL
jgi:hypothetical protein